MTVSPEQLAAFADGELDELTAARVHRAIEADPALALQLEQLIGLRSLLAARFDPVLAEPVPVRLTAPLEAAAKVVSLSDIRAKRALLWQRPAVRYGGGMAIAASLLVAVLVGQHNVTPPGYAGDQLASALDSLELGQSAPDGTRMLISFRKAGGQACRGFSGQSNSGIACRDTQGWKVQPIGHGSTAQTTQYQQAGSADAAVMAAAQDLADGPALDAAAENAARKAGWR